MDNEDIRNRVEDDLRAFRRAEIIRKQIEDDLRAISSAESCLEVLSEATDDRHSPITRELNKIINDFYKKIEIDVKKMKDCVLP